MSPGKRMQVSSAQYKYVLLCLSQAYVPVFSYASFSQERKLDYKERNTRQQHIVRTGFLMPEHNKDRSTRTNAHAGQEKAEDVNTGARVITFPEQIGSDASACACQEHAESMLGRRRGGGRAGDRLCACTRCDVSAGVCQVQKRIYSDKIRDAGSPSERDANERDNDFFSARVVFEGHGGNPTHLSQRTEAKQRLKFKASDVLIIMVDEQLFLHFFTTEIVTLCILFFFVPNISINAWSYLQE